jgi:hypothetical protein
LHRDKVGDESGEGNVEGESKEVETYIWIGGTHKLESGEWDFAGFQREKMKAWVGYDVDDEGLKGISKLFLLSKRYRRSSISKASFGGKLLTPATRGRQSTG